MTVQPFEPLQRTEWQRRHFEQVSAAARLASEKALPELLAALDSRALRERLAKQCAQLAANSSASELLRRLRAEYSTAEVVSSFDAESPSGGPFRKACTGLTLPLAQALALTLTLTLTLTLAGLLVELHPR